jgi:hypothetical protein
MKMNVLRNSGSCASAEIHSNVEAVRPVLRFQSNLRLPRQRHHFGSRGFVERDKRSGVLIRHDHQVAARIRKQVEDYKIKGRAVEHEVLSIIARILHPAKDASRIAGSGGDVLVAPWTPDVFHVHRRFGSTKESRMPTNDGG